MCDVSLVKSIESWFDSDISCRISSGAWCRWWYCSRYFGYKFCCCFKGKLQGRHWCKCYGSTYWITRDGPIKNESRKNLQMSLQALMVERTENTQERQFLLEKVKKAEQKLEVHEDALWKYCEEKGLDNIEGFEV